MHFNIGCLLLCLALVTDAKLAMSYYDLLGVPRTYTQGELKKTYRKLAKDFHPDKITDPTLKEEAAATFIDIAKGYAVLSDPEIREKYDELVKYGIYEYDKDAYDEWDARRNGWRSPAERDWSERLVLWSIMLVLILCGGGGFYYSHKEKEDKAKRAAAHHQSFIAKLDKQRAPTKATKAKANQTTGQPKSRWPSKAAYQTAIKVYHKALKKALRARLEDNGVWFAPTFASEDISTLMVSLSAEELTQATIGLCGALGFDLPETPPSFLYDPSASKPENEFEGNARSILKALKMRSMNLPPIEDAIDEPPNDD